MMVILKYLSLSLWIFVLAGSNAYTSYYGQPHFNASYTFHDNGDPNNPFAERYYTSCTYIGVFGQHKFRAIDGRCNWFKFIKETS